MITINKVQLLGRLTKDPELRQTNSGTSVCRFTVAVDRRKKQGEEKQTDFISCTAWGKTAEFIAKWFGKGKPIALVGSIRTGSYDDKDGRRVYTTEVWVDDAEFVPGNKDDGGTQGTAQAAEYSPYPPGYAPPGAAQAAAPATPMDAYGPEGRNWESMDDAELPF